MIWLRYGVTALVAVALAWLVVVQGLAASAIATGNAQAALAMRPRSATALSLAAEQALNRNDFRTADRLARQALVQAPRDVRALRVLGVAVSMEGQPRKGSELLLKSGALGWRDDVTQLWLIRQAIEQRNYSTATQRIDAMLRRRQSVDQMLTLLHQLAAVPAVQPAVIDRLAEMPEWRARFFYNMVAFPKESVASHAALIEALRKREGSIPRGEVAPFVNYLIGKEGNVGLARKVWLDAISPGSRLLARGIYDGDFTEDPAAESEQPRYAFEWQLDGSSGAYASIGTPPMLIGESALNVKSGEGPETRLARQLVVLGSGRHQLGYAAVIGDELRPDAFEWRVLCADGKRLETRVANGRSVGASRTSIVDFVVPDNCPAQWIDLMALGGEAAVSSEAWFDHVSVR